MLFLTIVNKLNFTSLSILVGTTVSAFSTALLINA